MIKRVVVVSKGLFRRPVRQWRTKIGVQWHPKSMMMFNRGVQRWILPPVHKMEISTFSRSLSSLAIGSDRSSTSGSRGGINESASSCTSTSTDNTFPFLLADIGEGIAEVELVKWFVQPGDVVKQYDPVCQVQSDKATVEIDSRYEGVIAALGGDEGDMISVGSPLLHMKTVDVDVDFDVDSTEPLEEGSGTGTTMAATNGSVVPNTTNPDTPTSNETTIVDHDCKATTIDPPISNNTSSENIASHNNMMQKEDYAIIDRRNSKVFATPAVRRLAKEHNIDLAKVKGTGPQGRVLKADLLMLLENLGITPLLKTPPLAPPPMISSPSQQPHQQHQHQHQHQQQAPPLERERPSPTREEDQDMKHERKEEEGFTLVPIRGYSRLMVNAMMESLQVPHMIFADEVDMTALYKYRKEMLLTDGMRKKISYLPFAVKALSLALKDFPNLNSSIDMEHYSLKIHYNHNIGIAMDSPRGLVVPVIRRCQDLSIMHVSSEIHRLQQKAIEGKLSEQDLGGATITLSNIGSFGGTYVSPVVLPPQVAIGALGRIQRLPRFVGDTQKVEEVHLMNISWGADHRVLDGATMARFSNRWKAYLENPMSMLFDLK